VPDDHDHSAVHLDVTTVVVILDGLHQLVDVIVVVILDGLHRLVDGDVGPLTAPERAAVSGAMATVTAARSIQLRA
jgi:hypothetical protein